MRTKNFQHYYFDNTEYEEDDFSDCDNIKTYLDMLTIEDSTLEKVPLHLEKILKSFDLEKSTSADLLIGIIYGITLECSFAAIENVRKCPIPSLGGVSNVPAAAGFHSKYVKLLSNMPPDLYDDNKMSYTLRLQLYFDTTGNSDCLMTGILTGDFLLLTLTPDCGNAIGKSICLSIGRYVLNAKGRPLPSRLRKLPELTYKLREHILVPVRKHLVQREGIVNLYPSLESLPEELYPYLFVYLSRNSLNKLANVCKRLLGTVTLYEVHKKRSSNRRN